MKSFKNTGWRFYNKMDQILPTNSIAHGSASYNPTSSAATGTQVPVPGPSVSNITDDAAPVPGPSTSTSNITHDVSTSIPSLMPPPSSTSSLGKRQLDDMTSVAPSASIMSESVSQLVPSESDSKKLKLTGTSRRSSGNGGRKGKDAASAAAWMNLQGSINRLTDGLTTSTVTEDSRVADETRRALDSMQAEEDLSHDEKIVLLNAFLLNARICTVYLSTTPELRIGFLRSIIQQVKHNIPFL